ncbi:uncharacterized protein [Antedon mediterranea]|uniref:uncharacterized protein n=1 Tax=Antedon mediterranea TaxID=105859 RepID=UPI003AF8D3F7
MATTIIQHPQPHTVVMPAAQTVQYHHQSGPLPSANLNVVSAKVTGWIQVSCGVLSIILGIVAIAIDACNTERATAIWCGAGFYLPAGILGVIAGHQKQSCPIIGCMVMSILSAICSVSHFSVSLSGALNEGDLYSYCYEYYGFFYDHYYVDNYNGKLAVNIILTIIAVVEFVVSIYASAVMCGGTSCCRTRPNTTVTVVSNQAMPTTTTQVIQTGYPAQQMQYGQPAYPYQPPPGNYPAGNYPPPVGNYPPPAGNYPPPSYQQTEKI